MKTSVENFMEVQLSSSIMILKHSGHCPRNACAQNLCVYQVRRKLLGTTYVGPCYLSAEQRVKEATNWLHRCKDIITNEQQAEVMEYLL